MSGGRCGRSVGHRDDPLPTLPLPGVVEDRHGLRRLHDLQEVPGRAPEVGQPGRHAPLAEAAILRAVGPVERPARRGARRRIERRRLVPARRRRAVLAARAGRQVVAADRGGLQQRELVLAGGVAPRLRLGHQRRDSAVGRIDDQRRPPAHVLVRQVDRGAVGAAHVLLAAALGVPGVLVNDARPLPVQLGPLLVGQELLVGKAGGPLQRDFVVGGPDALQVGLAPRSGRGRRGVGPVGRLLLPFHRHRGHPEKHCDDGDRRRNAEQLQHASSHVEPPVPMPGARGESPRCIRAAMHPA